MSTIPALFCWTGGILFALGLVGLRQPERERWFDVLYLGVGLALFTLGTWLVIT